MPDEAVDQKTLRDELTEYRQTGILVAIIQGWNLLVYPAYLFYYCLIYRLGYCPSFIYSFHKQPEVGACLSVSVMREGDVLGM